MARRVVPTAFPTDPQLTTCEEFGAAVRAARTASGLTLEEAALAVRRQWGQTPLIAAECERQTRMAPEVAGVYPGLF